jgi:hypothetical protein
MAFNPDSLNYLSPLTEIIVTISDENVIRTGLSATIVEISSAKIAINPSTGVFNFAGDDFGGVDISIV